MDKKWELVAKIKSLVGKGFVVHGEYKVGDNYGIEKIGNLTLRVTIRNRYYNNDIKQYIYLSKKVLDRTFNNLIKETNAEKIYAPVTNELGYEDSLRWLFHHYPYGETDNSNCILINASNTIIGIQYNNCKETSIIHSNGTFLTPDYVVLNNCKKLEGKYRLKDYEELIPVLEKLFKKN